MQEVCAVGIEAAITKKDPVITAYRCHGWAFTRGISIKAIMAEMMGTHGIDAHIMPYAHMCTGMH